MGGALARYGLVEGGGGGALANGLELDGGGRKLERNDGGGGGAPIARICGGRPAKLGGGGAGKPVEGTRVGGGGPPVKGGGTELDGVKAGKEGREGSYSSSSWASWPVIEGGGIPREGTEPSSSLTWGSTSMAWLVDEGGAARAGGQFPGGSQRSEKTKRRKRGSDVSGQGLSKRRAKGVSCGGEIQQQQRRREREGQGRAASVSVESSASRAGNDKPAHPLLQLVSV